MNEKRKHTIKRGENIYDENTLVNKHNSSSMSPFWHKIFYIKQTNVYNWLGFIVNKANKM